MRAHNKSPYKIEFHMKTLRALNRPMPARTVARSTAGSAVHSGLPASSYPRGSSSPRRVCLAHGDTVIPQVAIGCRWLPFLRDLRRNLAIIAVSF
jgi:hypothetical protein